ncbi:ABC transporter substrate-binding protein [Streptomyces yokosukanensis]|uniref:ABC transporter substrate-binding protein n=1 Tax=Streptomyces yokosukanensis TaxID=67386 RepID=UPI003437D573
MKRTAATASAAAALLLPLPLSACGASAEAGSGSTVTVTVGHQSKTINTVTAGTLLRSLGSFEKQLDSLHDGHTYKVDWQDYATGAPITAQMTAGKIDIGSMGDFPLLLNAARGTQLGRPTRLVSVTGYNLRGGLNTVVTAPDSQLASLKDLKGKKVSTSIGSAADGTLVRALQRAGINPDKGISKLNQQPAVGASALTSGSVDALSQFVAWPGLLAYEGKAKALYDGAQLNLPTFHGVTAREDFAQQHPSVLEAFLKAQAEATDYLNTHPVAAAEKVAETTGLPAEVVYLYNGAHGIATFDPAVKPRLVDALKQDVSVLKAAKLTGDIDVDSFVDDRYVKRALGASYTRRLDAAPAPVASEVWPKGSEKTVSFKSAKELLAYLAGHRNGIRAAYVPDAATGTLWFADRAVWVTDGNQLLPFVTPASAQAYVTAHGGARTVSYREALERAS